MVDMTNSNIFQNKICPKENTIQGKYNTGEQIKCRKQSTEGCLLGSHDLPGLWLSKTNCCMHQSRVNLHTGELGPAFSGHLLMKAASLFASLPSYAEGERSAGEAGVMVIESVTWCLFQIQGKRCTGSWRGLVCLHTNPYSRSDAEVRHGSWTLQWHLWESEFYEDFSLLPFNHLHDSCSRQP